VYKFFAVEVKRTLENWRNDYLERRRGWEWVTMTKKVITFWRKK